MTLDQAASDEYFPGHGCLTGDCPHEKYIGCFTDAFKAGHAFALNSPVARADLGSGTRGGEIATVEQLLADERVLALVEALETAQGASFDYITYMISPEYLNSKAYKIFKQTNDEANDALAAFRKAQGGGE